MHGSRAPAKGTEEATSVPSAGASVGVESLVAERGGPAPVPRRSPSPPPAPKPKERTPEQGPLDPANPAYDGRTKRVDDRVREMVQRAAEGSGWAVVGLTTAEQEQQLNALQAQNALLKTQQSELQAYEERATLQVRALTARAGEVGVQGAPPPAPQPRDRTPKEGPLPQGGPVGGTRVPFNQRVKDLVQKMVEANHGRCKPRWRGWRQPTAEEIRGYEEEAEKQLRALAADPMAGRAGEGGGGVQPVGALVPQSLPMERCKFGLQNSGERRSHEEEAEKKPTPKIICKRCMIQNINFL